MACIHFTFRLAMLFVIKKVYCFTKVVNVGGNSKLVLMENSKSSFNKNLISYQNKKDKINE